MAFADGVRIWFIVIHSLALVGSLVGGIRFRSQQEACESSAPSERLALRFSTTTS